MKQQTFSDFEYSKNRGKLLMDATVAPADIKYPTDIDLLNKYREHLESAVDILWNEVPHKGHKLPYSAKKARKSYLALSKSMRWTKAKCGKRTNPAVIVSSALTYIITLSEKSTFLPNIAKKK